MHAAQAKVNGGGATGLAPFELGIGVTTGPVAAALLGSEERWSTPRGRHGQSRPTPPAVGRPGRDRACEATYQALADPPPATALPPALVKGREAPVSAWRWRRRAAAVQHRHRTGTEDDDVMEARGVRKTYEAEGAPVRALRGVDVTMDDRVRGGDGAVGMRQVDPAEPGGRARHAHRGRDRRRRRVAQPTRTRTRWPACAGPTSGSCSNSSICSKA